MDEINSFKTYLTWIIRHPAGYCGKGTKRNDEI